MALKMQQITESNITERSYATETAAVTVFEKK